MKRTKQKAVAMTPTSAVIGTGSRTWKKKIDDLLFSFAANDF